MVYVSWCMYVITLGVYVNFTVMRFTCMMRKCKALTRPEYLST